MANITSAKTGREGTPLRKELPRLARETTRALNQDTIVANVRDREMRRLQSADIDLPSGDTVTRPMTHMRGWSVRRQLAGRRSYGGGASW